MTRFIVPALFLVWLGLVAYGVIAFHTTEATGDSFVRGLNRVVVLFKWQGLALLVAFVCWRAARALRAPGFLGRAPIMLSGGFFLFVIVLYGGAIFLARM